MDRKIFQHKKKQIHNLIMLLLFIIVIIPHYSFAQPKQEMFKTICTDMLLNSKAYEDLTILAKNIGHRLSGSPQAEQAVEWAKKTLEKEGFDVRLQPVMVPQWIRGEEKLEITFGGNFEKVNMLSLGNSEGTEGRVLEAPVVLVETMEELLNLKNKDLEGKIVFFNFHFPHEHYNTFDGYSAHGPYRTKSVNEASKKGAAAIIIRSIGTDINDAPHTGMTSYAEGVRKIPALAIGNISADKLANELRKNKTVKAKLQSNCHMKGMVLSHNVIAEIKGTEHADQYILVGGHLDSWDVGEGAHDDGSGCVQAMDILRCIKRIGWKPRHTIRAVLFMNEENGVKGGLAYADSVQKNNEHHLLAIESDAGGFSPRGLGLVMPQELKSKFLKYKDWFLPYGVYDFSKEWGGVDIGPLKKLGVPLSGLVPDSQRYFDVHHSQNDVLEAVNPRELKLGAAVMAQLIYLADNIFNTKTN